MADSYAARDNTMSRLPWTSIAPPFTAKSQIRWVGGVRSRPAELLEDENAKLKRLLADTMLDNVVLNDLLGKSWTTDQAARGNTWGGTNT